MKALARLHLSALGLALTFAATPAYAQSQGMLDNVLNKYKSMAAAWASVLKRRLSSAARRLARR